MGLSPLEFGAPAEAPAASGEQVVVLLNYGSPTLADRCQAVSPRIAVVLEAELEANPERLAQVEVVYGRLAPEEWAKAPRLRWLQTAGAGVEWLLTPEVVASDVIVTNASGIHAAPITEHMFGMLLSYNRKLCAARQLQGQRSWESRELAGDLPLLEGMTLGLLGLGAIGSQSARVGKAFGMRVLGMRRSGLPHPDVERVYPVDQVREFLGECDVVMNSLPLTPTTRGLIGAGELEAMRAGAILINTGRGGTIDTGALVEGLRRGRPAAALLDVTDPEPLPPDHPFWTMENVWITPHYSGSHARYAERAEQIFLENLRRYLNGEPLRNVVDKAAGY